MSDVMEDLTEKTFIEEDVTWCDRGSHQTYGSHNAIWEAPQVWRGRQWAEVCNHGQDSLVPSGPSPHKFGVRLICNGVDLCRPFMRSGGNFLGCLVLLQIHDPVVEWSVMKLFVTLYHYNHGIHGHCGALSKSFRTPLDMVCSSM